MPEYVTVGEHLTSNDGRQYTGERQHRCESSQCPEKKKQFRSKHVQDAVAETDLDDLVWLKCPVRLDT